MGVYTVEVAGPPVKRLSSDSGGATPSTPTYWMMPKAGRTVCKTEPHRVRDSSIQHYEKYRIDAKRKLY